MLKGQLVILDRLLSLPAPPQFSGQKNINSKLTKKIFLPTSTAWYYRKSEFIQSILEMVLLLQFYKHFHIFQIAPLMVSPTLTNSLVFIHFPRQGSLMHHFPFGQVEVLQRAQKI